MDEPLSNLDAKLRVQMRAEIARLQRATRRDDGLRHARSGRGDDARRPGRGDARRRAPAGRRPRRSSSRRPANVFVAGFIGSPAMNLVHASIDDGLARFGGHALALPDDVDLGGRRTVVVGISRRTSVARTRSRPARSTVGDRRGDGVARGRDAGAVLGLRAARRRRGVARRHARRLGSGAAADTHERRPRGRADDVHRVHRARRERRARNARSASSSMRDPCTSSTLTPARLSRRAAAPLACRSR